jgi:excisionase family DNA binding protein
MHSTQPNNPRQVTSDTSDVCTVRDAAEMLRCTPNHVRRLITAGELPADTDRRPTVINIADIRRLVDLDTDSGAT